MIFPLQLFAQRIFLLSPVVSFPRTDNTLTTNPVQQEPKEKTSFHLQSKTYLTMSDAMTAVADERTVRSCSSSLNGLTLGG